MALTATPLSENWMIKECIDEVRSITKEEDEQIASDDNIRGHLDWAIHNMIGQIPSLKWDYIVDVPFVVDDEADPFVSTVVRPTSRKTRRPHLIKCSPDPQTAPTLDAGTGLYDYHYTRPTNFAILSWWNVWNELTGTCRETSDYSQLMGHALGNNPQLARTVAWYAKGRNLWISSREGMVEGSGVSATNVVIHGMGIRTPLRLIRYDISTAPTGVPEDYTPSEMDETFRYIPIQNDWEKIDLSDLFVPLAINLACVKVWSQVTKMPREQEDQAIAQAYAGFYEQTEAALIQREQQRKGGMYTDRSHA